MYYNLVQALKRRLILELQQSFSNHPVYQKITPFIQNRFSFAERPQYGIVIKGSNASKVQLSGDNFIGDVKSHVMLGYVERATYPLEWVREDSWAVQRNGGVMPTSPGVYFLEILTAPTAEQEHGTYAIDPLITVTDEALLVFQSGVEREAQLQRVPISKTLRLYENLRTPLKEGTDFVVDYATGAIRFIGVYYPGAKITADYRYAEPSIGPIQFQWNTPDHHTLPGVVLAFGKRAKAGDKVAVVVYPDRTDVAQAFGGKFEASFDISVIARDPTQMEEIADLVIMYLWGEKKSRLEFEGIEILDVSMGGETEEVVDETGDLNSYQASMTVQLRADWEAHVPLPFTISRVTTSGLKTVNGPLFFNTHPALVGRNNNFERIG